MIQNQTNVSETNKNSQFSLNRLLLAIAIGIISTLISYCLLDPSRRSAILNSLKIRWKASLPVRIIIWKAFSEDRRFKHLLTIIKSYNPNSNYDYTEDSAYEIQEQHPSYINADKVASSLLTNNKDSVILEYFKTLESVLGELNTSPNLATSEHKIDNAYNNKLIYKKERKLLQKFRKIRNHLSHKYVRLQVTATSSCYIKLSQ